MNTCGKLSLSSVEKPQCLSLIQKYIIHPLCRRFRVYPLTQKIPGEENSNPLQFSCLWKPMDREPWLASVSTTNWHLPLALVSTGLNHMLLQMLIFNTPWKEFRRRLELRHSCSGEIWQNRSLDRYFQDPIIWAQFLYLLIWRKALQFLMVRTAPCV